MEGGAVVPAGLREGEEVAHVLGRPFGMGFDAQSSERCLQRDGAVKVGDGDIGEGIFRLLLDGDLDDAHGLFGFVVRADGGARDGFDDAHAVGDASEGGIFSVQRGLG